jgi:hypothetical protein
MLRVVKTSGYAFPGESVRFERSTDGRLTRIVAGGVSSYPEEMFRGRYAAQPLWHTAS